MTRLPGIAAILIGLIFAAAAHAAEPFARVQVMTAGPFQVGHPIKVEIQVLAPNYFLSAVNFPQITIPGAIVAPPDERPINFSEKVGGETFSGIMQIYSVVPQQAGTFTLPPIKIDFAYAAVPGQKAQGSVTVPQERFDVVGGASVSGQQAAAPSLTIEQSFDRDLGGLRAGDALERTITVSGRDMPAMMIPPPRVQAPDGVKLYRHDPVLADGGTALDGRRIERLTYEFPRAGDYVLPAISEGGANLPEVRIHIAAAASTRGTIAPAAPAWATRLAEFQWGYWVPRAAAVLAGAALLVVLWIRYGLRGLALAKAWQARRADSESACFAKLTAACGASDQAAAYRALQVWSSRAGLRSLSDWTPRFGGVGLADALERLQGDLFGPEGKPAQWDGAALARELTDARGRWRKSSEHPMTAALPALN